MQAERKMIKSKFKSFVLVIIAAFLVFTYMTIVLYYGIYNMMIGKVEFNVIILPFSLFTTIFSCYLFWVEFRSKMAKIVIDESSITIIKFAGLSEGRTFSFLELTGYKSSSFATRYGLNRILYLIKGENSVATISDYYLVNGSTIWTAIKEKLEDLGNIKINAVGAIKAIM